MESNWDSRAFTCCSSICFSCSFVSVGVKGVVNGVTGDIGAPGVGALWTGGTPVGGTPVGAMV